MSFQLRIARKEDSDLFLRWKNDPAALLNSFDSNPVSLQQHISWFNEKLQSPSALLLVFEDKSGRPAGQVRFETSEASATVGITIDEEFRCKGLGAQFLQMACAYYFEHYPAKSILAYIKKDNLASYKTFLSAGFSELKPVEIAGFDSYQLIKQHVGF